MKQDNKKTDIINPYCCHSNINSNEILTVTIISN